MRIALVAPLVTAIAQPYTGGAQAIVADLALGMTRRGHEVTLFAREGSVVPGVHVEPIAVPDSVAPSQFSEPESAQAMESGFIDQANVFLELFLQLRQRSAEFDVIHVHAFDYPAFAYSTLITRIPVIHTVHLPAISPEVNSVLRLLHRQRHPLTLVTVSQACARDYSDYTPFDYVIYNGLEIEAIPFAGNVDKDAPLLFAGRITPEKGVVEAIEIAERAGHRLIIAGGIYDQSYYERSILPILKREQATDRISFLGQLDHATLWKLMGKVSALLFPILWDEPFGLAPVEAMATGTPVIAFKRGALPEIVQHGRTGFLVEPGDIQQAAALVACLPDIKRADCRVHVEVHFSQRHMLDAHEHLYETVSVRGM
jgi:UDP-glucose:tetrahydrobiopterin glucosyltransferase